MWQTRAGEEEEEEKEALWGGEVRGRPATATAATARGRRQIRKEGVFFGRGQHSVRTERFLHDLFTKPPPTRRCFDGDLKG